MNWRARAFSVMVLAYMVLATAALVAGWTDSWLPAAAGIVLVYLDTVHSVELRRRQRAALTPESPPRPDADVAQHLNADDRAWMAEFAPDWTDPTPRRQVRGLTDRQRQALIDNARRARQSRMARGGPYR